MREGLVSLSHLEGIFLLLDRETGVLASFDDLIGEAAGEGSAFSFTGGAEHPTEGEGELTLRLNLDRDLIYRASDTLSFHLEGRGDIPNRFFEALHRLGVATGLHDFHTVMEDAAGRGFLPLLHEIIHERFNKFVGVGRGK